MIFALSDGALQESLTVKPSAVAEKPTGGSTVFGAASVSPASPPPPPLWQPPTASGRATASAHQKDRPTTDPIASKRSPSRPAERASSSREPPPSRRRPIRL